MNIHKIFLTILFFNNIRYSNAFINNKPIIFNKIPTLYLKKNINTDMFNDHIYNRKTNITITSTNNIVNISTDTKNNNYIYIEYDNKTNIFNLDHISYQHKIILRIYIYILLTYYFIFLAIFSN